MTLHNLNRISGLLLSLMQRFAHAEYSSRMLRHALACVMKAKGALKRNDEPEAMRLVRWAYGSVRLAVQA